MDSIDGIGGVGGVGDAGGAGAPDATGGGSSPEMAAALLEYQQQLNAQSAVQLQQMMAESQAQVDALTGGVGGAADPTGSMLFANGPLGAMAGGANPVTPGAGTLAQGLGGLTGYPV